ncbi:MAG: leucine-rich repeat domain-containing protein [Clostridia bacterium]|nr:leucine-rich repeat domain-containing protein [Clostridia bacterium]
MSGKTGFWLGILLSVIIAVGVIALLFGRNVSNKATFVIDGEQVAEISVEGFALQFSANSDPFFIGKWTSDVSKSGKQSNWYIDGMNLQFVLPSIPAKVNYSLDGWHAMKNNKEIKIGQDFFIKSAYFADLKVYAKYVPVEFELEEIEAPAYDENGSPILDDKGNTVWEVVAYNIIGVANKNPVTITDLSIPTNIDGIPVESIKAGAFSSRNTIKNLKIPASIIVEEGAFAGCNNIVNVKASVDTISKIIRNNLETVEITFGREIPANLFAGCKKLSSVTLPGTLETIGASAFKNCTALADISLPNGVETIGASAFEGCSITSINIPETVTDIGLGAFAYCPKLAEITVHEDNKYYNSTNNNSIVREADNVLIAGCKSTTVTDPQISAIADYAFAGAVDLTEIILPESVKSIGENAFAECVSLTSVDLTKVESIADSAFAGCLELSNITATGNANYLVKDGCLLAKTENDGEYRLLLALKNVKVNGDIVEFNSEYAFVNGAEKVYIDNAALASGLDNMKINFANITEITGALDTVKHFLSKVNKKIDVTIIKTGVIDSVDRTDRINSLTIGEGVTTIGANVFKGTYIYELNIFENVTEFGENAFAGSGITVATVPAKAIGAIDTSALTTLKVIGTDPITSADGAEAYALPSLTSLTLGKDVTVDAKMFVGAPKLATVSVEEGSAYTVVDNCLISANTIVLGCVGGDMAGASKVGAYAFAGREVTDITMPANITEIAANAFAGCASLEKLVIDDSVAVIGEKAFENCTSLNNLTIHAGIGSGLAANAFDGCNGITVADLPSYALKFINIGGEVDLTINDRVA